MKAVSGEKAEVGWTTFCLKSCVWIHTGSLQKLGIKMELSLGKIYGCSIPNDKNSLDIHRRYTSLWESDLSADTLQAWTKRDRDRIKWKKDIGLLPPPHPRTWQARNELIELLVCKHCSILQEKEYDSKGRVVDPYRQRLTKLQAAEIYIAATEAHSRSCRSKGQSCRLWMPGRTLRDYFQALKPHEISPVAFHIYGE